MVATVADKGESMALRITIDLFSGRPNPSVVVTGLEERELLERLAGTAGRGRAATTSALPAGPALGYRGLLVEPIDEHAAPAARTRKRAPRAAQRTRLRVASAPDLEDLVCSPSGPFRAAGLEARFFDHLAAETARVRQAEGFRATARARAAAANESCACAPLWEPEWWNDGGPIQAGNNCYNYAVNYRSDSYAQPGRANGAMYASISPANVRAAALADALLDAPLRNKCPRKGHLVALCVSDWDFHWYRKQRSGNWTHKPGPDPITQLDNANVPITDPRTADRGPYTRFVGFLTVLHGHVKIG